MSPKQILFSFKGRISRSTFFKYWLLLAAFVLLGSIIDLLIPEEREIVTVAFSFVQLWPNLAIFVKRWHDRNRSLWFVLLALIPFVGVVAIIWILVEIFFVKGTDGPNPFGEDPLQGQKDSETKTKNEIMSKWKESNKKNCPYCNASIDEDIIKCEKCGNMLPNELLEKAEQELQ